MFPCFQERCIGLDTDSIAILNEALAQNNNKDNLLFWDYSRNNYMSIQASNSSFKRFCQKYNIGKGFEETQYVLRHSFATRKIESGMPSEVLKDLLGHKNIKVTLNTYFDAFAEYRNKYNLLSENYIKEHQLNYIELDKNDLVLTELSKLENTFNFSYFDDFDKKIFTTALNQIKLKYTAITKNNTIA